MKVKTYYECCDRIEETEQNARYLANFQDTVEMKRNAVTSDGIREVRYWLGANDGNDHRTYVSSDGVLHNGVRRRHD